MIEPTTDDIARRRKVEIRSANGGVQLGRVTNFTTEYVFVALDQPGEGPHEIPVRREALEWAGR
jgi:hypothetical protein